MATCSTNTRPARLAPAVLIGLWAAAAQGADGLVILNSPSIDTAPKASEVAAPLAPAQAQLGPPRLFDQERGLAVDRTDPRNVKVVAYVDPCWIVPVKDEQPPGSAGPLGLIVDRGTGKLVAHAHDVVPMPRLAVYYVDSFQLPVAALEPNDSVGSAGWGVGNALNIRLDLGGGNFAQMNVQPASVGANVLAGGTVVKVPFGGGTGKMVVRQYGAGSVNIVAVSDDGSLMASVHAQKTHPKLEERFKAMLRGLADRPDETRIWPADARPWASGLENWAPSTLQVGDVGMWCPQETAEVRPGLAVIGANTQVYVAARVMHPYELPPGVLIDGLQGAKVVSEKPARLEDWVGVCRVYQFQGPAVPQVGIRIGPVQPGRQIACQAMVLDLHKDVRRLMIRCQAPQDQYAQRTDGFVKLIEKLRIPKSAMEPILVPLDPASHRPARK